jgi:hypothetical protein
MRFVSAFLATGTLVGPEAKVTQVLSKDLPDFPGKEGLMLMVEYPQGSSDPVHRHNADAFVYVLEFECSRMGCNWAATVMIQTGLRCGFASFM